MMMHFIWVKGLQCATENFNEGQLDINHIDQFYFILIDITSLKIIKKININLIKKVIIDGQTEIMPPSWSIYVVNWHTTWC